MHGSTLAVGQGLSIRRHSFTPAIGTTRPDLRPAVRLSSQRIGTLALLDIR
jgi:hypothetical protein